MSSAAVLTLTVGIVVLVFMFYVSYKNYSNRVDYLMGRGFYALMPKSYLDYWII